MYYTAILAQFNEVPLQYFMRQRYKSPMLDSLSTERLQCTVSAR